MANILVVDDDEITQMLLETILSQAGHNVSIAGNGSQGCALAQNGGFDLALMDMNMPELNGFEAIRLLKADERTKALPIIAITASKAEQDRSEARQSGCDAFIPKPIDAVPLLHIISKLIK